MKALLRLVDLPSLSLGDFPLISCTKVWFAGEKKKGKEGKKEAKMIDFNGFRWRKKMNQVH